MKIQSTITTLILSSGLALGGDKELEIRLADCPPAVRTTIEANARGGQLDEIKLLVIGDRELYIAEVELVGDLDLDIHVRGDGTLVKTREDVPKEDHPRFAERLASEHGGQLDDVDKELSQAKTTYHIEIDRRGQPDLDLITDEAGNVLSKTEDHDD
ncbi:MAG: hypothetical protein KDN05_00530 [Verrucomicrobiae bacterium]|nr:hypothetical protein [Verrucomicrobiae bacterium]